MDHLEGKPVTYYVVQTFKWLGEEIVADEPREVMSREAARIAIENMPLCKVGGLSFSRTGNPMTGEFGDAEIIAQSGVIPTFDEEWC